ncbi:hypothetical protein [Thiococcus pfennigii]|uniref:hypothetical protein n=1 Tax=Thiococcus pfennigii TaxID=1057 RepID=UPI0019039781|nr:hypothetical protein [Thiococcus pfennigii]
MTSTGPKIGTLGEKALQFLCAQASIVATRTDEDRLGWDYFLEVPSINAKYKSPDKTRSVLRCLVQVKTTTTRKQSVQIKVAALKPLIDADLPAYIVLFELKNNRLNRCHIRHLDQEIIERTLKSLRQSRLSNFNRKKKSVSLSIRFPSSAQIDITGDALARKLWLYVPTDISDYLKKKEQYRKWVGYDSIPMELKIQSDRSPYIELIEHDLGLVDQLNVPKLSLKDRRFDIEVEEPLAHFVEGKMTLQSHAPLVNNQAAFTFSVDPEDQALTFAAEHRASQFNSWVPMKDRRFRLSGGWFDILVCPFSEQIVEGVESGNSVISGKGTVRINQKVDFDVVYAGDLLQKLVRASHYLATRNSIHFTVWFNRKETPLESELTGPSGYPSMEYELDLLESLGNILKESEIDLSICSLSLNQLYSQAEEISFFEGISINSFYGAKLKSDFSPRKEGGVEDIEKLDRGVLFSIGAIRFENYNFIVLASTILSGIDLSDRALSAEVSETKLLNVLPLLGQTLPVRQLQELVRNHLSEIQPDLIIGNFRPSIKKICDDSNKLEKSLFFDNNIEALSRNKNHGDAKC